jgi:hypothetical protein
MTDIRPLLCDKCRGWLVYTCGDVPINMFQISLFGNGYRGDWDGILCGPCADRLLTALPVAKDE